ncbi:MAG: sensor domain-containing diguanylate cyclase [Sporomusaceae bacterium]|nr:sensor domain-containing diguanylate cyclase [Sporomusaceae bacterium]
MLKTDPAALIKAVVDTVPAALLLVNPQRQVQDVFISNRRLRYFRHYQLDALLNRFLLPATVAEVVQQVERVIASQQPGRIHRISFPSRYGQEEYAACRIEPLPQQQGAAVVFLNESEIVLLEQEFQQLSEQAETAQRELCDAMSEMDFRLMDLNQSHKQLQVLFEIASIAQKNCTEQDALEEIVDIIIRAFACIHAAVFLVCGDMLVMKARRGDYCSVNAVPVANGIMGYAVQSREQVFVPDVSLDPRYIAGVADCVSELAIPLIVRDQVIGVLDLQCPAERSLSPYDMEMLRTAAAQAALVIAHIQHVALIEKIAITDDLTGLYNFHHFSALLEQECRRACRYNHALALLMIDIDCFKSINDSFGHLTGNEILARVARIIASACRDVDWVCRYGGEEFAVLLPETTSGDACALAERVRQAVAGHSFREYIGDSGLSVSIGVSSLVAGASPWLLVEQADAALLAAKRATKNCVCFYGAAAGMGEK